MEVQFVSDVEIDLFATRGDDECHIRNLPYEVLEKNPRNPRNSISVIGLPLYW